MNPPTLRGRIPRLLAHVAFHVRQSSRLLAYVRLYGPAGVWAFLKLRAAAAVAPERLLRVRLPGYPAPVRIPATERATFEHVFVLQEYALEASGPIRRVLDAGANLGFSAVYLARRFPEAEVVAVECDDENYRVLTLNVAPYARIRPVHAAVWSRRTRLRIKDLSAVRCGYRVVEDEAGPIQGVTISDLEAEAGGPFDLLKCDVEGAELALFGAGMTPWVATLTVAAVECHSAEAEAVVRAAFQRPGRFDVTQAYDTLRFTSQLTPLS